MKFEGLRPTCWLLAGVFILQMLWVAVVPAFGGMDEFDHAYRAASVARGDWNPPSIPAQGRSRGELIPVPVDIVRGAHHACAVLKYTGPQNCNAVSRPDESGLVLVASSAALYNPAYYWFIGTAARPFEGTAALYAMRIATVLLSDVFLGLAMFVAIRERRSTWLVTGLLLCLTPTLLDSTATTAPNGIQTSAGLAMWVCGLALFGVGANRARKSTFWLIGATTAAAVTVATVHTTGPLWVFLFLCTIALLTRPRELRELVLSRRRAFAIATAVLGTVTAFDVMWTLLHGTNSPSQEHTSFGAIPMSDFAKQPILWILQTIGGVPFRNVAVPVLVFALGLVGAALLIGAAFKTGTGRIRLTQAWIASLTLLIPVPLTVVAYAHVGFAWQGRYSLPFAFGLMLVSAYALAERASSRLANFCCLASAFSATFMQTLAAINVRNLERAGWHGYAGWSLPATWILLLAGGLGGVSLVAGSIMSRSLGRTVTEHEREVEVVQQV